MSQTSPPTITGSPTVPQRSDRATFSSRVDDFVTWMAAAVSEFGAVATNVYNNAVDAYNNAVSASASASTASNAAASAVATAGATQWVSGTTYALGAVAWSPSNSQSYRRIIAGTGTTDPSSDGANWALLGGDVTLSGSQTLTNKTLTAPTLTTPVITNYTETVYAPAAGSSFAVDLANGTVQKLTTNANATITLPASVAGKSYLIMVAYGGTHSVTWAGGSTIKWSGGTAPTATSVNGKFDVFAFTCDGTSTYGRTGGANF